MVLQSPVVVGLTRNKKPPGLIDSFTTTTNRWGTVRLVLAEERK